jgi:hypothetical protein
MCKRPRVAAAKDFSSIFSLFALIAVLLISTGCARRAAVAEFNGTLDISCIRRPVRMIGCDFSQPRPKCKRFEIDYPAGCEQIEAKRGGR